MKEKGTIPEKNSNQWKKNEKIINENPVLRKARDISEGFSGKTSTSTGGWTPTEAYKNNYDAIFGKKDKKDLDNEEC